MCCSVAGDPKEDGKSETIGRNAAVQNFVSGEFHFKVSFVGLVDVCNKPLTCFLILPKSPYYVTNFVSPPP
jgi:hypothetical protein